MDRHHVERRGECFQFGLQPSLLGLELGNDAREAGHWCIAIQHGGHRPIDPPCDFGELALLLAFHVFGIGGEALSLRMILPEEKPDLGRVDQMSAQSAYHRLLDVTQVITPTVIAGARVLKLRAHDAHATSVLASDRHPTAARAATKQARQHVFGLSPVRRLHVATIALDRLHRIEEFWVDDRQMRHV